MKHTIFLLDNGKRRKFIVDIDLQNLVTFCAIKCLEYSKNNRQNALDLPAGIDVWETDNLVIHPKITPKTNYVKLACDLDVGDIIPFAQTVDGKEIKQKFATLNIIVESCPLPKDVSGFGAVKVIKMDR